MSVNIYDSTTNTLHKVAGLVDDTDLKQDIEDIQAVIPSGASAENLLATANDISSVTSSTTRSSKDMFADLSLTAGTTYTLNELWQKIYQKYGECTFIGYVKWSGANHFYITDGTSTVDIVNGEFILNIPAYTSWRTMHGTLNVGVVSSDVESYTLLSARDSSTFYNSIQHILFTSDLTSTATQGSGSPITSGGVYSELNKKAEKETYWVWDNQTTFTIDLTDISNQRIGNRYPVLLSVLSTVSDSHSPKTHLFSIGIIATASAPVSIISVGGDEGFTASVSGWTATITCPHPYNNAKLFF